jgi:hypothetical protein
MEQDARSCIQKTLRLDLILRYIIQITALRPVLILSYSPIYAKIYGANSSLHDFRPEVTAHKT